ncbi:UNVERIFIED_CONTAM: Sterol 14-demethylase [Sesamum radiatum]|uniref:Sterol 14-demethylase n=1 Tax=Sesamum radiatum TaxID=300843 RepID=A0AAW2MSE4_SESRA
MSAVLDEQKNLMQKHGNKIDYDILSEMEALYRCIKEALRLHPPLIMLLRSSHSDFSVKTREGIEYDIPKGHIVATSPAFANRLPIFIKIPIPMTLKGLLQGEMRIRQPELSLHIFWWWEARLSRGAVCLSTNQGNMEPFAQKL